MITPIGSYRPLPTGRVLVLEHGRLPTTDIYLRPRLEAPGMPRVDYADMTTVRPGVMEAMTEPDEGLFAVVCRYISGDWLKWIEARRHRLSGVAYMVDDDLPTMLRDRKLPLRYRHKIWRLYGRHRRRLSALCSELWVSTPELATRYAAQSPRLLPPLRIGGDGGWPGRGLRYFYHGTAAHRAEIEWLRDVVAMVQIRNPAMNFEIFGDRRVHRLYRGIERVAVLHPMGWPDYLAHTERTKLDIGLAPLLPGHTNDARSHTRFYDIARAGAVGIFADRPPYAGFVQHGRDGLLLPDDKQAWAEAILELAADEPRRRRLAEAARARGPRLDDALAHLTAPVNDMAEAAE